MRERIWSQFTEFKSHQILYFLIVSIIFFDWYIQLRVGTNMEHSSNMLVVKVEKYNLFITGIELGNELKWGPNEVAYLWVQNRWKAYIN